MGLFWGILWGNLPQLMLQIWALLATAMNPRPPRAWSRGGTLPCCYTHTATLISHGKKITPWKQAGLIEWVQWLSIPFLLNLLKEMKNQPTQQTQMTVFSITGGRFWNWSFPPPSLLRSPSLEVIHYVCMHFIQMGVQVCQ